LSTALAMAFIRWIDAPLTRLRHVRFKSPNKQGLPPGKGEWKGADE